MSKGYRGAYKTVQGQGAVNKTAPILKDLVDNKCPRCGYSLEEEGEDLHCFVCGCYVYDKEPLDLINPYRKPNNLTKILQLT